MVDQYPLMLYAPFQHLRPELVTVLPNRTSVASLEDFYQTMNYYNTKGSNMEWAQQSQQQQRSQQSQQQQQQQQQQQVQNFQAMQMLLNQQQVLSQLQQNQLQQQLQPQGGLLYSGSDPRLQETNIAALMLQHQQLLMAQQQQQQQQHHQQAPPLCVNVAAAAAAAIASSPSSVMPQVTMPLLSAKQKKAGFPLSCTRTTTFVPKVSLNRYRKAWDRLVEKHPQQQQQQQQNDNNNNNSNEQENSNGETKIHANDSNSNKKKTKNSLGYDQAHVEACFRKLLLGQRKARGWDQCQALRPKPQSCAAGSKRGSGSGSGDPRSGDVTMRMGAGLPGIEEALPPPARRRMMDQSSLPFIKRARHA